MPISLIRAPSYYDTKSTLVLSVVFSIVLLFGIMSLAYAQTDSETTTVLIYMVSSDLEYKPYFSATKDIEEMKKAVIDNPNLNVVIQIGGSDEAGNLYSERELDYTSTTRISIKGDQINIIENLGQINTGDPSILTDFLIWGIENFPADKYHVIFWDHGAGSKGYGKDMNFTYSIKNPENKQVKKREKLLLGELSETFSTIKRTHDGLKFDLIGFDSCLMANIEVADLMSRYGNYLVASQSIEPSEGWDYTSILSSLNANPSQSGEILGKTIASTFLDHHKNLSPNNQYTNRETLSVIDLSKVPPLTSAWREINHKIFNEPEFVKQYKNQIMQAHSNAERYGDLGTPNANYVDLRHAYEKLGEKIPDIKSNTDNIIKLIDDAVIFSVHVPAKPNANGLNVYEPLADMKEKLTAIEGRGSFEYFDDKEDSFKIIRDIISSDVTPPSLTAKVDGLDIVGEFDEDDIATFSMIIKEKPTEWEIENDMTLQTLAMTELNLNDFPDGKFSFSWNGQIPALSTTTSGGFVTPEYFFDDNVVMAYVPIYLYSENFNNWSEEEYHQADKIMHFSDCWNCLISHTFEPVLATLFVDVTNIETANSKLFARNVYINEQADGTFAKNSYELKNGDMVEPLAYFESAATGEQDWAPNAAFVVDDEFGLEYYKPGYTGGYLSYVSEFTACDFNDNCSLIGPFEYTLNDDGVFALKDVNECKKEAKFGFDTMVHFHDKKNGFSIDIPNCWDLNNLEFGGEGYSSLLWGTVFPYGESPFGFWDAEINLEVMDTEEWRSNLIGLSGEPYLNQLIENEKWFCDDATIHNMGWNCKNFQVKFTDIISENYDEYILTYSFTSEDETGQVTNMAKRVHSIPTGDETWELVMWIPTEFLKDNTKLIDQIFESFEIDESALVGDLISEIEEYSPEEETTETYQKTLDAIQEAERTVDPLLQKHRYIQAYFETHSLWIYYTFWGEYEKPHPEIDDLMESMQVFMKKNYPDYPIIPLEEEWYVGMSKAEESDKIYEIQYSVEEQIEGELYDRGYLEQERYLYDEETGETEIFFEIWLKSDGSISEGECSKMDTCAILSDGIWTKFDGDITGWPDFEKTTMPEKVPNWIKNNAKWWADGQIGEDDFVSGIQFLITEKIINIEKLPTAPSQTNEKVPNWIKQNAKWWADGQIGEVDFIRGIEYLVEKGIIQTTIAANIQPEDPWKEWK